MDFYRNLSNKNLYDFLLPRHKYIFLLYFCAEINTVLFLAFLICALTMGCVLLRIVSVAPILVEILKPFLFSLLGRAAPILKGFSWAPSGFNPIPAPRVVCAGITPSPCSTMGGSAVAGAPLCVFVADESTKFTSWIWEWEYHRHCRKLPLGSHSQKFSYSSVSLRCCWQSDSWADTKLPNLTPLDFHLPRVPQEGDISHSFPHNKSWQPRFQARCWMRQTRVWFDNFCLVTLTPECLKLVFSGYSEFYLAWRACLHRLPWEGELSLLPRSHLMEDHAEVPWNLWGWFIIKS